MHRVAAAIIIAFAMATPTTAQMNPAAIGGGLVMPSAINAQAKALQRKNTGGVAERDPSARETCAELPEFRRVLGANHPRNVKLTALCREAGYPEH